MATQDGPQGERTVRIKHLLDPQNEPFIKRHYVNDSDGDTTSIFSAQAAADNGDWCLEQRFEYATVSGVKNVVNTAWRDSTWDSGWDISF